MGNRQGAADLRVQRTRRDLRASLLAMADEHGFDAVTVGGVAARAMVNRATFYRHYEDKEDLAVDVLAQLIAELPQPGRGPEPGSPIDQDHRIASGARLFELFARHRRLFQPLLGYPRNRRFMVRARELLGALIRQRIDSIHPDPEQVRMPTEVVVAFTVETLLGVVAWWLDRGIPHSPRQLAVWFTRFVDNGYFDALGLDRLAPERPSYD